MCPGQEHSIEAGTTGPRTVQEHAYRQVECNGSPQANDVWPAAAYRCASQMMGAEQVAYPSHASCYANTYKPTSLVTFDGVNGQTTVASTTETQNKQGQVFRQAECNSSPQAWPASIYQCSPETMVAEGNVCPSHGVCYVNTCQPTSWITVDGVTYFPTVLSAWPQPPDCGQLDQAVSPDGALPCASGSDAWRRWRDPSGCRQVQQAFEDGNDEERMALASVLNGRVWEALRCPHANHVVQKCIKVIRPASVQFIIDELVYGGDVAQAARHRYGCRILQRLLEHCSAHQVTPMVEALLLEAASLSSHSFGHYVMQHMLEFCTPDVVSRLTSILVQHVPNMVTNDCAGEVIDKALSNANNDCMPFLAQALLQAPEQLAAMACSRWGKPAVEEVLRRADGAERLQACKALESRSDTLKASRYGRAILKFVAELQESSAVLVN